MHETWNGYLTQLLHKKCIQEIVTKSCELCAVSEQLRSETFEPQEVVIGYFSGSLSGQSGDFGRQLDAQQRSETGGIGVMKHPVAVEKSESGLSVSSPGVPG